MHLKLAPPLPGGCLLSCGFPFCSPCTYVYLLSSNLYRATIVHISTWSRAPLLHLTLTRAPLHVHLTSCTSVEHLVLLYACTAPRKPHLVHINSCISMRAPHHMNLTLCTSTRAPLCVHRTSCTSPHTPHLVHLYACTSCTSRAYLRMHLYVCTSARAPLCVHLILHVPLRVHLISCAPLVHHLHSFTNQPHAPIKPIRRHIQEGPGPFR